MPMYDRNPPAGIQVVDEWDGGVGWLAHPDEDGERISHAVVGNDGIWVFDPLDVPGVDDLLANVGNVVGIAVFSNHHSRDAAVFAERYDLPVHVPTWLESAQKKVDAPVVEFDGTLGKSGFVFERIDPIPMWTEAIGYRESDRTLYVPDILLTARSATVGDERLAVNLFLRPFPPQSSFENVTPEQIIVGHGEGIFEGAKHALTTAFSTARPRFLRGIVKHGPAYGQAGLQGLREMARD